MVAKEKKPENSKQSDKEYLDLVKELSNYTPPKSSPIMQSSGEREHPDAIPFYLKELHTSTGVSIFDATIKIIRRILAGLNIEQACLGTGENYQEFLTIMQIHHGVSKAINFAKAENLSQWISKLRYHADKDWRAAALYLTNVHSDVFHDPKGGQRASKQSTPKQSFAELTDEELVKIVEARKQGG